MILATFMKKLSIFLVCLIFTIIIPPPQSVKAAENFVTDYDVKYTVKNDGVTRADMKVALTNSTSDYYYASSYKIELGFDDISNVTAFDLGGALKPVVEKTPNGYTLELVFNKKIVGVGNKQEFTITFDTSDVAQKIGKIWEINIPGIEDEKAFHSFNVNLIVPSGFGRPVYIKPEQTDEKLHFTKDELSKSGISLAYGSEQQYSFNLKYHLQNKNLFPIRTEIAIPTDTNYQDVFLTSIIPEPVSVKKDIDGNYLAEYELNPAQKLEVTVVGVANIFLTPRPESISDSQLAQFIKEKPYWQISNNKIKELAKIHNTPESIYQYVIETLDYDFSRVTNSTNRLGAVGVLEQPSTAVCLEFTDLFIAIARAAGIPAREVDGYAYTENSRQRPLSLVTDILHAWPEYYDRDKQTWIMIDPTWADTTNGVDYFHVLDFDHFAFIKKGESSSYPIPAGGYKIIGDKEKKDILIAASEIEINTENILQVRSLDTDSYIAGFPIEGSITIFNKGPDVLNNEEITLQSSDLTPSIQTIDTGELLPYQQKEVKFRYNKKSFLTNQSYDITMQLAGIEYRKKIKITPVFAKDWKIIGGVLGVVFTLTLLIVTIKTRRIRLSR